MRRSRTTLSGLIGLILVSSLACGPAKDAAKPGPVKVELKTEHGKSRLFVDGKPFYIRGAGLEFGDFRSLAAHGGNAFRTWRTDNGRLTGEQVLDSAYANGLYVSMGLEIARERAGAGRGVFGFDYDDEVAVASQRERVRKEVLRLKDSPALIIWGIGNELNLGAGNPRVWDAVNDLSKMIHELDPNHLTTTMLAGINKDLADEIRTRAPDLDLISIQMYADIVNLPRYLREIGWDRPYMITEWGATGHWEVPKTPWGAPIENNSSVKADFYRERYEEAIASDSLRCVGSFVFLWGQKQERTPTWYGLFLQNGDETESIDVMQYLWTGTWPLNRSPRLEKTTIDGKTAHDGIRLRAGQPAEAIVRASDLDGDSLRYHWEIRPESTDLGEGGDDERIPDVVAGRIASPDAPETQFTTPEDSGAYRLFVYVYDGMGHAAHANVPFFVDP